jgi:hypothetical protein
MATAYLYVSRLALSKRNIFCATHIILNFLVANLKKKLVLIMFDLTLYISALDLEN